MVNQICIFTRHKMIKDFFFYHMGQTYEIKIMSMILDNIDLDINLLQYKTLFIIDITTFKMEELNLIYGKIMGKLPQNNVSDFSLMKDIFHEPYDMNIMILWDQKNINKIPKNLYNKCIDTITWPCAPYVLKNKITNYFQKDHGYALRIMVSKFILPIKKLKNIQRTIHIYNYENQGYINNFLSIQINHQIIHGPDANTQENKCLFFLQQCIKNSLLYENITILIDQLIDLIFLSNQNQIPKPTDIINFFKIQGTLYEYLHVRITMPTLYSITHIITIGLWHMLLLKFCIKIKRQKIIIKKLITNLSFLFTQENIYIYWDNTENLVHFMETIADDIDLFFKYHRNQHNIYFECKT